MFVNYDNEEFYELWDKLLKKQFISPFYSKKQLEYTAQRLIDDGIYRKYFF